MIKTTPLEIMFLPFRTVLLFIFKHIILDPIKSVGYLRISTIVIAADEEKSKLKTPHKIGFN